MSEKKHSIIVTVDSDFDVTKMELTLGHRLEAGHDLGEVLRTAEFELDFFGESWTNCTGWWSREKGIMFEPSDENGEDYDMKAWSWESLLECVRTAVVNGTFVEHVSYAGGLPVSTSVSYDLMSVKPDLKVGLDDAPDGWTPGEVDEDEDDVDEEEDDAQAEAQDAWEDLEKEDQLLALGWTQV